MSALCLLTAQWYQSGLYENIQHACIYSNNLIQKQKYYAQIHHVNSQIPVSIRTVVCKPKERCSRQRRATVCNMQWWTQSECFYRQQILLIILIHGDIRVFLTCFQSRSRAFVNTVLHVYIAGYTCFRPALPLWWLNDKMSIFVVGHQRRGVTVHGGIASYRHVSIFNRNNEGKKACRLIQVC